MSNAQRFSKALFIGSVAAVATLVFCGVFFFRTARLNHNAVPVASSALAVVSQPISAVVVAENRTNLDFEQRLNKVIANPDLVAMESEFGRLLRLWVSSDPEAALAWMRTLPTSQTRCTGLLIVLNAIARLDIDRGLTLAAELLHSAEEKVFYNELFNHLSDTNPVSALGYLARVTNPDSRRNALQSIVDVWFRHDPNAARAWIDQLPKGADRSVACEVLATELAKTDPLDALDVMIHNLDGKTRDDLISTTLRSLAQQDPQSASAFLQYLPAGEPRVLVIVNIARALSARGSSDALVWAGSLSDSQEQRIALRNVIEVWAASDETAVRDFIAHMNPGVLQDTAVSCYAALYAGSSILSAKAWAETMPSSSARQAAISGIASTWARSEPAACANWLNSLPENESSQTELAAATTYWLMYDPVATRTFIENLPPARQRAAAIAVAPGLAQEDPVSALAWTSKLSSQENAAAATEAAFRRWQDNDPVAATAWLAASFLPASQKAQLANLHTSQTSTDPLSN